MTRMLSSLDINKVLLVQTRRGFRRIPPGKWFIDRNTPVGEDADIYERKLYGGRRLVPRKEVLGNE